MRDGLDPRTTEIQVPECSRVQDTKILSAFGGDVDVAFLGECCGCDPEDFLI